MRAKAAIFAMQKGTKKKLYVVPTSHLRKVAAIYVPAGGKSSANGGRKPQTDWTRYENAWHLLVSREHAPAGLRQAQEADDEQDDTDD